MNSYSDDIADIFDKYSAAYDKIKIKPNTCVICSSEDVYEQDGIYYCDECEDAAMKVIKLIKTLKKLKGL